MKNIQEFKNEIRKQISKQKQEHSAEELLIMSEEVWGVVEIIGVFQEAKTIFIYNSILDEVSTVAFINRWEDTKDFYLPVVSGDTIVFRKYDASTQFTQSEFGIDEPIGQDFIDFNKIDLVIVPGVAFDRKLNRLGRGKGYYDKFLTKVSAPKIGICFDFQLIDTIPTEPTDIPMDYVVSENELIWK